MRDPIEEIANLSKLISDAEAVIRRLCTGDPKPSLCGTAAVEIGDVAKRLRYTVKKVLEEIAVRELCSDPELGRIARSVGLCQYE